MTLDNSKSKEQEGNYWDKTQNLFETTKVSVIKCEFLKVLPKGHQWDSFLECVQQGFA